MTAARRVIAFRFDRHPLVCRDHLAILRRFNPGIPIHGVYGGRGGFREAAFRLGRRFVLDLDGFFASTRDPYDNWKHGDEVLVDWFRESGQHLDFDVLHYVEWDLVVLAPVEVVYAHVPDGAVGLTALTPLAEIEGSWEWLDPPHRAEWQALLRHAQDTWRYDATPHACLACGPCLPRSFLEAYSELDPPFGCVDELRYPLIAQSLGFPLADTGLRHGWRDEHEQHVFNVGGEEIARATIVEELAKRDGRRAFHPVRHRVAALAR